MLKSGRSLTSGSSDRTRRHSNTGLLVRRFAEAHEDDWPVCPWCKKELRELKHTSRGLLATWTAFWCPYRLSLRTRTPQRKRPVSPPDPQSLCLRVGHAWLAPVEWDRQTRKPHSRCTDPNPRAVAARTGPGCYRRQSPCKDRPGHMHCTRARAPSNTCQDQAAPGRSPACSSRPVTAGRWPRSGRPHCSDGNPHGSSRA